MWKKFKIPLAIILTVALATVFYYLIFERATSTSEIDSDDMMELAAEPTFLHPLSGLPIEEESNLIAVSMVFDNFNGLKQPGLEEASVIYEALAEGEITRLLAIFDGSLQLEKIGPVRSARPYFVDWASEYGGIFMHVGGSPAALSQLRRQSDVVNIDQIGAYERYFQRDESLDAPHNVFTSYTSWLQIAEQFKVEKSNFTPWKFASALDNGTLREHQVEIDFFSGNSVGWVYNKDANNYLRFLNSERVYFTTGDQISAKNLIIIETETEVIDSIGRRDIETTGSGDAIISTSGQQIEARWIKECQSCRMRFLDTNQEEVVLTPGQTWLEVVPDMDQVTFSDNST